MLTEQDKERIRDEEIYRNEIQNELKAKTSTSSKIWKGLNSPFILILFSSLIFKLISDRYTEKQNKVHEVSKNQEVRQNICLELCNRMAQALSYTNLIENNYKNNIPQRPNSCYFYATQYLNNNFTEEAFRTFDYSVRPEYQRRGFNSLLVELNHYLDTSEHKYIAEVINDYNELNRLSQSIDTIAANIPSTITNIRTVISTKMLRSFGQCGSFSNNQIAMAVLPDMGGLNLVPGNTTKKHKH